MKKICSWILVVSFLLFSGCISEETISGDKDIDVLEGNDAGSISGGGSQDAPINFEEAVPPELPLVDPKCSSLRLMEFKSAEIGPEGGLINLAFTKLRMPKEFLEEKTKITIARYGLSEKASMYDYYILLPEGLKSKYRKFDVTVYTGRKDKDIYSGEAVWGYIREDDFWRASTQTEPSIGHFMGFFRDFYGKIGIRENVRKKSDLCPDDAKKSRGATRSDGMFGQSREGKCFDAEYIQTTEGCEDFGAICHKGLAGNFLCETCLLKRDGCDRTPRLDCCQVCEIETITDIDFKCTSDKNELTKDIECLIEEYFFSGDCAKMNQGNAYLRNRVAEMENKCPAIAKTNRNVREIADQTCVTIRVSKIDEAPTPILRYPKWEDMPAGCADGWKIFDCKLREHEREHYRIGLALCENARIALQELSSAEHCSNDPAQAEAEALADLDAKITDTKEILNRIGQDEQDDFDKASNHGNVAMQCPC